MAVSARLVKELRERTSAPMMDCKKALEAVNGDVEAAIEAMRKSGQAKAVKKAGRITAEGAVLIKVENQVAVILEANCETDFVGRDENFLKFANAALDVAVSNKTDSVEAIKLVALADGKTLEETRLELVTKIGENIQVRRIGLLASDDHLGHYLHGGKIGVIVAMTGGDSALAKDVAMHIAASKPEVINPEEVSADRVAQEKRILTEQALESGKPADIVEKMIGGRMRKFVGEISLTGQAFIKDPAMTVGALLKQKSATVNQFVRFEVGEGIEKQEVDFREEVMAQVKGGE
jgi:elongation factor Ts